MRNELDHSLSPYLLQHRDNPVHWQMWGKEALAEAQRLGKPILLSIGYAACHWCHVMAHESFEDQATADLMNDLFVNIKVDREERPDIDHIYMSALHALGQHGGWPLTMFLTPSGEPFWGGTYFPPQARYGQPAFKTVLREVRRIYQSDPDRITHNTMTLTEALRSETTGRTDLDLTPAMFDGLAERLGQALDPVNGGLSGAPKFPNAPILEFLWRGADRQEDAHLREALLHTLRRICQGGIYDHLGGGFARYTVDARWLVPHFEKMLYDNAQLLDLLNLAHQATGEPLFRARMEGVVDWLVREMTDPQTGAFFSSLDADSEGVEGKFYVWSWTEIADVLDEEDAAFFARFYDCPEAGNWHDEHTGQSTIILNRLDMPLGEAGEEGRLEGLRQKLLARRGARIRPGLDDKILADWNGLMIAALVQAGLSLQRRDWIAMAERAFHGIVQSLAYRGADGHERIGHSFRGGQAVRPGFALDHVQMIRAALCLQQARPDDPTFLAWALDWARALETYHLDPVSGLLTQAANDAQDLIVKLSPTSDDAVPNAHSVWLKALIELAAFTGDETWRDKADALLHSVTAAIAKNPFGHCALLSGFDYRLRAKEIVLIGKDLDALRQAATGASPLNRIIVDFGEGTLPDHHPTQAQRALAKHGAVFICSAGTCSLPIYSTADLRAVLSGERS
ncbi:thioredoxin domain-containing protein [Methylovirgula sp. 4M-Z18]|uniref:thioredoxin domain-containing protein n=1 Tax=Methylovirgula sp. 4M-Z18 TaxID=2293567 RepID=UPI000E2F84AD|nr:thioredoxin domain-containing protein [Methylovirgula sp. 4M-Z18]RFB78042.1 thioredoxin domain-containing protein [Methylovirgula sp. 4M-Z18]